MSRTGEAIREVKHWTRVLRTQPDLKGQWNEALWSSQKTTPSFTQSKDTEVCCCGGDRFLPATQRPAHGDRGPPEVARHFL